MSNSDTAVRRSIFLDKVIHFPKGASIGYDGEAYLGSVLLGESSKTITLRTLTHKGKLGRSLIELPKDRATLEAFANAILERAKTL